MISIIVPFYNSSKFLNECLSSIKAQTFSDFECLLIDDGSSDSSREIAESYTKEDSRFILLNKEHVGFPQAKNIGLDYAKGEYICFIDSDDAVHPRYLELLYKGITKSKSDICGCNYIYRNDIYPTESYNNLINLNIFRNSEKMEIMYRSYPGTYMWNKIYKKELFNNLRHENVIALSDTIIMPYLFDRAKSVSVISNILYFYRNHKGNITYNVRHNVPTYWAHRLNVHVNFSLFILKKYPELIFVVKKNFLYTFNQCKCYNLTDNLDKNNLKKLGNILGINFEELLI